MDGTAPMMSYEIKEMHNKPCYLVDEIYSDWTTPVKIICNPQTKKRKKVCQDARSLQERCGASI
jgi:hypothetical protein